MRDEDGKVTTVRYEAVNAMLLNEFLKEHRAVKEQQALISGMKVRAETQGAAMEQMRTLARGQEAIIARQEEQIEALQTGLEKVSNQVRSSQYPFVADN